MKALILKNAQNPELEIVEMGRPSPGPGEVLVRMKAAALNRRDLFITMGMYPGLREGAILGSDGCGVVERVHDSGDIEWEGEEVIINPNVEWGRDPKVQSPSYRVLGMPDNGTFSEYMVVGVDRLVRKPAHLNPEQSAALPLTGLTAYRALFTHAQIRSGQKLLVTGIGGGVSQMVLKLGLSVEAECYVTSGNEEKIQRAMETGAKAGFNYREQNWQKSEKIPSSGFDVIIDSAGGEAINNYIQVVAPGGKIVTYGSTTGKPKDLDIFRLFWKQASLQGSTMGNDEEFLKMVDYVSEHEIIPEIDKVALFDNILSQFERMRKSEHYGKLVVVF